MTESPRNNHFSGMDEIPSQNMTVQRLGWVAVLAFDLPSAGLVTNSGEILTTGSHKKKNGRTMP